MARPRSDIAPRILHAARARFLVDGVDGASLRGIAEDAGTSIGMVYYYFPTKDDLFLGVVEEVYVALLADLEAALRPELPVAERIRGLFRRLGALSADELLVLRIVVREVLALPARLDRLIARFQRGHLPLIIALIKDGFAAGTFDARLPLPVVGAAMMVLAGPAQAILRLAGERGVLPVPPPGTVLPEQLMQVLLGGVAAPSTPAPRGKRQLRPAQPVRPARVGRPRRKP
jgi:AcrR family transcriptional regulator